MFTLNLKRLAAIMATGTMMMMGHVAYAAGTASGTPIANTVTVDYQVGGANQAQETDTVSFDVDNIVDVEVDIAAAIENVVPGQADQVLTFTVTNEGNTTQGYSLNVEADAADDFNMNNVRIYIETGGVGGFDGTDTLYTQGGNNNAGDLIADGVMTVYVVSDTPPTGGGVAPLNTETAVYYLLATTLDSGTVVNAAGTTTADNSADAWAINTLQVVFAEATPGLHSNDDPVNEDGEDSETGTYVVVTSVLVVTKTQAVTNDGFSPVGFEKAIPGATITYTITLVNAGAADATTLNVVDTLPATLTYTANTTDITITTVGTDTDMTDGGAAAANTGAQAAIAGLVLTVDNFTVPAGETATITFEATIN